MNARQSIGRWAAAVCLSFGLAACGGGGGGGGSDPGAAPMPAAAPPDARNGTYTLLAANAREYELTLDFDARTYRVAGNGLDQGGSFSAQADEFRFQPGNSVGITGTNTARFTTATDAVVGAFTLPEGTLPFIAARSFLRTVAAVVGTYNLLGRILDTGGAPNTTIQQAEITASGQLRVCEDATIFRIGDCPASSVISGPITVTGDVFLASTPQGGIPFRVAQVGADKVFLRASAGAPGSRRFVIGTLETGTFTGGTFVGGTTEPAWGTVTVSATNFTSTGITPTGQTFTRSGPATATSGIEGIRSVSAGADGNFFASRSSEIGVAVAARNSIAAPGWMAIGRRQ